MLFIYQDLRVTAFSDKKCVEAIATVEPLINYISGDRRISFYAYAKKKLRQFEHNEYFSITINDNVLNGVALHDYVDLSG